MPGELALPFVGGEVDESSPPVLSRMTNLSTLVVISIQRRDGRASRSPTQDPFLRSFVTSTLNALASLPAVAGLIA